MSTFPVDTAWGLRRSLRRARARGSAAVSRVAAYPRAPAIVLVAGMAVLAVATALISVRVTSHTFDEDLYKASAAHYAFDGLPGSLFHDFFARGPARLYSLILMPLFKVMVADEAIRAAHVISCLLFASAAIPAYLLARLVVRSRWSAVLAGLGSILVPWSALAATIYTEPLAYPLFLWAMLALWRAVDEPSPSRDLLALAGIVALVATRTQFGFLLPVYVALIAVRELSAARRAERSRFDTREGLLRLAASYPWTAILTGLVAVAVLGRAAQGHLHEDLQRYLGGYAEIQDRTALGQQYSTAAASEVLAVAFGTGIVAAVVGGAWYGRALAGRLTERARLFALHVAIVLVGLVVFTLYAQGGWLRNATEERYYIYVVPLLWVGLAAALERRVVTRAALAVAGTIVVLSVAAADILDILDDNYVFLAPVHAILSHLVPVWLAKIGTHSHLLGTFSPLDFRAFLALALVALTCWAWGRGATARGLLVAGAVAAQIAFAAYAWAAIDGHVAGVNARTGRDFAQLGWIDRNVHGEHVRWLDNQDLHDPIAARNTQLDTGYYNAMIRGIVLLPDLQRPAADATLLGLPQSAATVDAGDRAPAMPGGLTVSTVDSPVLQLDAPVVRTSPNGTLALLRVPRSPRVLWSATGLAGDNWILGRERPATVRVGRGVDRVTLVFARPPQAGSRIAVELGGARRTARMDPGTAPVRFTFRVCGPATGRIAGHATGTEPGTGRPLAGALAAVRLHRGHC